ncbi:hypothetical protein ACVR1G_10485 [Streptococcus dentasini]
MSQEDFNKVPDYSESESLQQYGSASETTAFQKSPTTTPDQAVDNIASSTQLAGMQQQQNPTFGQASIPDPRTSQSTNSQINQQVNTETADSATLNTGSPTPVAGGIGQTSIASQPVAYTGTAISGSVPVQQGIPVQGSFVAPQKPHNTKKIVWSIIASVSAVILIAVGILVYRQLSGNVDGSYQVKELQADLKDNLAGTSFDGIDGLNYSDFSDDLAVETVIEDDVVKARIIYSVDYDSFYDLVKKEYSSTYSSYKSDFSTDEWNYLMDTLIEGAGYDESGFEKILSEEVDENGFEYDDDKGLVTGAIFEGKVNRVKGKIEITKVNSDSDLSDFEKGQQISYKKTASGLTLKDEDGGTMEFNKD